MASHGLAYVPTYCQHVQYGKVGGQAAPVLEQPCPGVVTVDAATGFAHSPIAARFEALIPTARTQGVAALAIRNSYNCGVLGYHAFRLAQVGHVGLGYPNEPASIAPSGGNTGVGVAVRVQLIAAAPTGATLGINASPFSGTLGGPKTGQFFTAIDPGATANGWFTAGMSVLVEAIRAQEGAHLPGHGCAFRRCGGQYGNSG